MAGEDDESDDDIPLLEDMVRPGTVEPGKGHADSSGGHDTQSGQSGEDLPLSEAEIEAIAARVVERHIGNIEQAVTRAIRTAIRMKARHQHKGSGSGND